MREYVLRIDVRDPEHPVLAETLVEFSKDTERPENFAEAVRGLAEMLRVLKTPEKAKQFILNHAALSGAVNLQPHRMST